MDCRHIQRDIPALVDGELRPRRAQEVVNHMVSCPECEAARSDYIAFRSAAKSALAYHGAPLSFDSLRAKMATIDPLEQIVRYQLPKFKIPGTVPRFAVAMILLVSAAGPFYACRHTRQVYVAVKSPFANQESVLTAALDDGYLPGDFGYDVEDSTSDSQA